VTKTTGNAGGFQKALALPSYFVRAQRGTSQKRSFKLALDLNEKIIAISIATGRAVRKKIFRGAYRPGW
jgi:hypothetical protein